MKCTFRVQNFKLFSALFERDNRVFWLEEGYTTKKIHMISINDIDIIYKIKIPKELSYMCSNDN